MTEIAVGARRSAALGSTWVDRAQSQAIQFGAWVGHEWRMLCSAPPAGAFHGSPPPADGYLTLLRSTWGKS